MYFVLGSWCTTATLRGFSYILFACVLWSCLVLRFDDDAVMAGGRLDPRWSDKREAYRDF
jgi:hypothetical protein